MGIISGVAPGVDGAQSMVGYLAKAFSDFNIERKATLIHEDAVIVLSKITGTVEGQVNDIQFNGREEKENIFFPGIPADRLKGKRFETMVLEVHCIRDWSTAMQQMIHGHPAPDFGFDRNFID